MSDRVDILLPVRTRPSLMNALEQSYRVHRAWEAEDPQAFIDQVAPRVRGLVVNGGPADEALMRRLPRLELIASYGVGYDGVDARAAARRGVVVTNTPGVLTEEVADLCVGLLLATIRELPQADRHVRSGQWRTRGFPTTASLRGRTVGIFGLGNIGRAIARRLEGFGVPICYCGRSRQDGVSYIYESDLVKLAQRVDTLICAVPGTPATRHAVNAEVFQALGAEGIFVNIGRGSTVDERALIAALESRTILAAGLDVFETEPHVPEKLLTMDNVVLLPHVGSGSTVTQEAIARLVLENVVSWFEGRGPLTPVAETPWVL